VLSDLSGNEGFVEKGFSHWRSPSSSDDTISPESFAKKENAGYGK
jgi:hypothetical protein